MQNHLQKQDGNSNLEKLFSTLPTRTAFIIKSRLSYGEDFHTYDELADYFVISRARVRQIEKAGIRKLLENVNEIF